MNPNLIPNLIANMTYKVSQRERAVGALFAVLGQLTLGQALGQASGPTLGSTLVKRNSALPDRLSDHAMAILRDGEMGEPESLGAIGLGDEPARPEYGLRIVALLVGVMDDEHGGLSLPDQSAK